MPSRSTVVKPGQRERQGVVPGRRSTMRYRPGGIGHRRSDLFDERRARGFHRDAGHHRTGRVADDAGQ